MGLMVNKHLFRIVCVLIGLAFVATELRAQEVRVKDLVNIKGVRNNQLMGFGLIIGLAGTGDSSKSIATNKAYINLMRSFGVKVPDELLSSQNVAVVVATAKLPTFAQIGDKLSVTVSTVGDAKSLAGGTLLSTSLKAGNNQIFALAQGSVSISAGDQVKTSGVIPSGASVEKEFRPNLSSEGVVSLSLRTADFTTNARVVAVINKFLRGYFAWSRDPGVIKVEVPPHYEGQIVEFISDIEKLTVRVDRKARVVINKKTGTVVMGSDVLISPVSVAHGDLAIKIKGEAKDGSSNAAIASIEGTSVGALVATLNRMGVANADIIAILQSVQSAGALQGELIFD